MLIFLLAGKVLSDIPVIIIQYAVPVQFIRMGNELPILRLPGPPFL